MPSLVAFTHKPQRGAARGASAVAGSGEAAVKEYGLVTGWMPQEGKGGHEQLRRAAEESDRGGRLLSDVQAEVEAAKTAAAQAAAIASGAAEAAKQAMKAQKEQKEEQKEQKHSEANRGEHRAGIGDAGTTDGATPMPPEPPQEAKQAEEAQADQSPPAADAARYEGPSVELLHSPASDGDHVRWPSLYKKCKVYGDCASLAPLEQPRPDTVLIGVPELAQSRGKW